MRTSLVAVALALSASSTVACGGAGDGSDGATTASQVDTGCEALADMHVARAHMDTASGACVIDRCEEGYANNDIKNPSGYPLLTVAEQAADGCEAKLDGPIVQKDLGAVSGDSGFNSSENDVARYTGFGGGDFVIHVQERSPLPHDMNVQVTLDADSLVNYSLEVEGPGTCRDPEGRGGVRSEGMGFGGGRRGAFALSGVSLTWPDKTLHDDRAEIHVHVRYVGGESPYSDGSFSLSVRSTDYRVSIDDPNKDGDMAQPSLACTP